MYSRDTALPGVERTAGATLDNGGVGYRVWAADHARLRLRVRARDGEERTLDMAAETDGYFTAFDAKGRAGDLYHYEFESGRRYPDPVSRFQPEGVHGPSEVIDARAYAWKTPQWRRPAWRGQTLYEVHVGTFTEEGTFRAAIDRLDHLVDLGVEGIELMPVADFGGDRNWGYDGVALYAPARCYGRPDNLRALVDAAHSRGLLVVLDVVYNHSGPNGNYLSEYSRAYFHRTHRTPWGHGFNYDGAHGRPVRDYFVGNACYWLDEFRIDGLRLDATHAIEDESEKHVLAEIAEDVHARGGFLIAEDERNSCQVLTDANGHGHGIDAVWSDDFHHQIRVALTGVRESYFASYAGDADAIATTLDHGWTYTGQAFPFWKGRPRGNFCRHLPPHAFVYCIQNHDQVGNRALGERLEHLVTPAHYRAASALLCLSPYAPLLFMGQEWAASTPFQFFTNHEGDLGRQVSEGRRREFAESGLNSGISPEAIPDPEELATFVRSKLDWREVATGPHSHVLALYRALLQVRKQWIRPALDQREHWSVFVAGPAVGLRFRPVGRREVLVVVSLVAGVIEAPVHTPALQLEGAQRWKPILNTESPAFGGRESLSGTALALSSDAAEAAWLRFGQAGAAVFIAEDVECL